MGLREFLFQEPPRKAPTGTSYSAGGIPSATQPDLDAETGSSQPVRLREVVPELGSPFQRTATYHRMMQDAGVDVSMRLYKTPVLGAEFFMEPYSDDPVDQEIAEFCWANLSEGMSAPFLNSQEDILHMYEDGFSVLEKVYEQREWTPHRKGANTRVYTMLKKLGPRPAATVTEILYDDNGGPAGIKHNAIRADKNVDEVEIGIDKVLIFTFNRQGGDLTGKSLLRTAYPHWYYKTHLYKIDAIQKERHALGVPKGKLQPGFSPSDKTILRTLLRNLRTNEESFMILTPFIDVEMLRMEGEPVDVLSSANHHNTMILLNVLGQFVSLGTTSEGGGRATAGTQSDMFMKSLKFVANQIAEEINMYLIPELVVWNYPTKKFPRLAVRNIGETRDIQMFAAAVSNLYSQDALTKGDLPTENWLRRIIDAPQISEIAQEMSVPESQEIIANAVTGNGNSQQGSVKGERTGNVGKPPGAFS